MLDHPEVHRFTRVATILAQRGWAEANAGNLSVRLASDEVPAYRTPCEIFALKHPFPTLDRTYFLVTATKGRARDVSLDPTESIGLVQIINDGTAIAIHWGMGPPTSEFPAHLATHAMCMDDRPEMKAVLHTHPPHLIAMSQLPNLWELGGLNVALQRMHPEVGILLPDGITTMEYRIPGSIELGEATRDALRLRNLAVWPMHGVVSLAPDLDCALDQVEIVEKAAQVYMLVLATGQQPLGLTDEQIRESRGFWGIKEDLG